MSQDTPAPPDHATGSGAARWFIWAIPLLLFAYLLSPGPVAKIVGTRTPPRALRTMYVPIGYLCLYVPAAYSFYNWYGKLWGVKL